MNKTDSKCLIIVGMHRSGTSFTASVLQRAGLNIGDKLVPANVGNDLGHFENEDFYMYHQEILRRRNKHPDGWSLNIIQELDENEIIEANNIISSNQSEQWGWKDPRTTLFLDVWKRLIPDAYFLFIYRKPWEVVESLFRRNTDTKLTTEPILTIENWQFYNEQIMTFYDQNKERSLLFEVENVMQQSSDVIELLNTRFGFHLKGDFTNVFNKNKFKNHLNETQQFFCESIFPDCISLYKQLQEKSSIKPLHEYKPSGGKMESLMKWWYASSQMDRLTADPASIINLINLVQEYKNKNDNLEQANTYLKSELDWITSSKLWRLRMLFK
jgi:hypothetical protein